MLLSELFRKLSLGELSNLSISGEGSGTIVEGREPKMIGYVNDALLALYSRFTLREASVLLELVVPRRNYLLDSRYAFSNQSPTPGDDIYIRDSVAKPFLDDVIQITQVVDGAGRTLPLNNPDNPISVFTPQPTMLQIPKPRTGAIVVVLYKASHPKISLDDDLTAEISLPEVLEPALRAYVAYLTFSHMSTQESMIKAADFMNLYEASCQRVEQSDLVSNTLSSTNTRFAKGGWV